jgi:hypothetical protein
VPAHLGEEELQRVNAWGVGRLEERLVELERLVVLLLEVVLEQQVKVMVLQKSGDGTFLSFVCWLGASSSFFGGAALETARLHPLQRSARLGDSRLGNLSSQGQISLSPAVASLAFETAFLLVAEDLHTVHEAVANRGRLSLRAARSSARRSQAGTLARQGFRLLPGLDSNQQPSG